MNTPRMDASGQDDLDRRLRRAFRGIDTREGFEARLMARLEAEAAFHPQPDLSAAKIRADAEYRSARGQLERWVKALLRMLVLDSVAAAAALVAATLALLEVGTRLSASLPSVSGMTGLLEIIAGPGLVFGVLLALSPLLATRLTGSLRSG
ncbi:MAG: hypothetical protein DIU56_004235 [Pseudomonadota bacterium]|jgi:hypothetical protein